MSRVKTLWVRQPYLSQLLAGSKTVEVRVGYDNVRRLQAGDRLNLNDHHLVTLRRVAFYADFEALLAAEDPAAIAPDLPAAELPAALRAIYPPDKEALGVLALEIEPPPPPPPDPGRRYDAVLLDMGYTLVDFDPPQEAVVQEVLAASGAACTVEEILAAVRVVWGGYYRDGATATFPPTPAHDRELELHLAMGLLAHLGLPADPDTAAAYWAAVDDRFSRPGALRPYAEVPAVLDELRARGVRLGIVSNWSWNLRRRVAQAGLDGHFELVWASAYAGCNKPHPAIFQQALARMNLRRERTLYVGDSYPHDVLGARNAGLDVVLLDRAGTASQGVVLLDGAGTAGPLDCATIRDLRGLLDLL